MGHLMMDDNFPRRSGAAIATRRIATSLTEIGYCVTGCTNHVPVEDLSWVSAGEYERFYGKCLNRKRVIQELTRFPQWFKRKLVRYCSLSSWTPSRITPGCRESGAIRDSWSSKIAWGFVC